MRVSDFRLMSAEALQTCFYCHQPLVKTRSLACCLFDSDMFHVNGTVRVNYYVDGCQISSVQVTVWNGLATDDNDKYSINFLFKKDLTEISHNYQNKITIDKIMDLDLTKITYEGVRDIITFI